MKKSEMLLEILDLKERMDALDGGGDLRELNQELKRQIDKLTIDKEFWYNKCNQYLLQFGELK